MSGGILEYPASRDPQLLDEPDLPTIQPTKILAIFLNQHLRQSTNSTIVDIFSMAKETPAKTGLAVGANRGHVRTAKVSPRGGSLPR